MRVFGCAQNLLSKKKKIGKLWFGWSKLSLCNAGYAAGQICDFWNGKSMRACRAGPKTLFSSRSLGCNIGGLKHLCVRLNKQKQTASSSLLRSPTLCPPKIPPPQPTPHPRTSTASALPLGNPVQSTPATPRTRNRTEGVSVPGYFTNPIVSDRPKDTNSRTRYPFLYQISLAFSGVIGNITTFEYRPSKEQAHSRKADLANQRT